MMKDKGITLIEVLTIVAIISIIAALAYPSFRAIIQKVNFKKDVTEIYGDFSVARSSAMEKGCDWDILFIPQRDEYIIFSDNGIVAPGPDGQIFTEDDVINSTYRNNGHLDDIYGEKITSHLKTLKYSKFGIPDKFNVNKIACSNRLGTPPENGIGFSGNILRFSYLGVARNGGAVYISNNKELYAISVVKSTGKITTCKWFGSTWK